MLAASRPIPDPGAAPQADGFGARLVNAALQALRSLATLAVLELCANVSLFLPTNSIRAKLAKNHKARYANARTFLLEVSSPGTD
jgi:hypothetical protein